MTNHLCQHFVKEQISCLTSRVKWNIDVQSIKENDLVLVVNENMSRASWQLGRIIVKVFKGPDDPVRSEEGLSISSSSSKKLKLIENNIVFLRAWPC